MVFEDEALLFAKNDAGVSTGESVIIEENLTQRPPPNENFFSGLDLYPADFLKALTDAEFRRLQWFWIFRRSFFSVYRGLRIVHLPHRVGRCLNRFVVIRLIGDFADEFDIGDLVIGIDDENSPG